MGLRTGEVISDIYVPGTAALVDGQPGKISWANVAPTPGFWWVGYEVNGVRYAGSHVDAEGFDKKGRRVFQRPAPVDLKAAG